MIFFSDFIDYNINQTPVVPIIMKKIGTPVVLIVMTKMGTLVVLMIVIILYVLFVTFKEINN